MAMIRHAGPHVKSKVCLWKGTARRLGGGGSFRVGVTSPVFLIAGVKSEHEHLVCPECPLCHLVEGAASGALHKVCVLEAMRVHASAAYPDRTTASCKSLQHGFDIVVALRNTLSGLRA